MAAVCVIPARGGSKRLPRKNVALLHGKPVLAYSVEAALRSGAFRQVWVSTDDQEIAAVGRRHGAAVHERPPRLATDSSTVVEVCLDFADWMESQGEGIEVLGVVLPTAALLQPEDLQGARRLLDTRPADYVMAVTRYLESPFTALAKVDGYLRPYFGAQYLRRSQDLPEVWVDSGYFYLARMEALRRERTFYGSRLMGYPIPRERSIDIDEPAHLVMAEALLDWHLRKPTVGGKT